MMNPIQRTKYLTRRVGVEDNIPRLRRLHRWLGMYRYVIIGYIAIWYLPIETGLAVFGLAASPVALYMLFVLLTHRKTGWVIFFVIFVGVPLILTFIPTGSSMLDTALLFLPLVTFFVYCLMLRYTVSEWISDASPIGQMELEEDERQSRVGKLTDDLNDQWIWKNWKL